MPSFMACGPDTSRKLGNAVALEMTTVHHLTPLYTVVPGWRRVR